MEVLRNKTCRCESAWGFFGFLSQSQFPSIFLPVVKPDQVQIYGTKLTLRRVVRSRDLKINCCNKRGPAMFVYLVRDVNEVGVIDDN